MTDDRRQKTDVREQMPPLRPAGFGGQAEDLDFGFLILDCGLNEKECIVNG